MKFQLTLSADWICRGLFLTNAKEGSESPIRRLQQKIRQPAFYLTDGRIPGGRQEKARCPPGFTSRPRGGH